MSGFFVSGRIKSSEALGQIVERVSAGEKIKALTGEVYTIPNEVEVIKNHNKFKRVWYKVSNTKFYNN